MKNNFKVGDLFVWLKLQHYLPETLNYDPATSSTCFRSLEIDSFLFVE
jgi:hypothetical protein